MEEFTLIVPDEGRYGALMSKHRDNPAQALLEPLLAHGRILRASSTRSSADGSALNCLICATRTPCATER